MYLDTLGYKKGGVFRLLSKFVNTLLGVCKNGAFLSYGLYGVNWIMSIGLIMGACFRGDLLSEGCCWLTKKVLPLKFNDLGA